MRHINTNKIKNVYRETHAHCVLRWIAFLFIFLSTFLVARAEKADIFHPPLLAIGRATSRPVLDGQLNDECWKHCVEVKGFFRYPGDRVRAESDTLAYATYDDQNLYLAFECLERRLDPANNMVQDFKAEATDDDSAEIWKDDNIEMFIAPENPHDYYHIIINSKGAVLDAKGLAAGEKNISWNGNIKAVGSVGDKSWALEIAIPFKNIAEKAPVPGTSWMVNFCRNNMMSKNDRFSSWSPASNGFNNSAAFGTLKCLENVLGARMSLPSVSPGKNTLSATLKNTFPAKRDFSVKLAANYGGEDSVFYERNAEMVSGGTETLAIDFTTDASNMASYSSFEPDGVTRTFIRSSLLSIKPDTDYEFSALVKADYSGRKETAVNCFSLLIPKAPGEKKGKYSVFYDAIKGAEIPFKTDGWQQVRAVWHSPGHVHDAELFFVKWAGNGISGKIDVDDISLKEVGSGEEVISNGDFSKGNQGWQVLTSIKEGYGNSAELINWAYSIYDSRNVYYRSPAYKKKLVKKELAVNSVICNMSHASFLGKPDAPTAIDSFALATGSAEQVFLVLRASEPESIKHVNVEIITPYSCKLVDPSGRMYAAVPEQIDEQIIEQDGRKLRKYTMVFDSKCIVGNERPAACLVYIPLVFEGYGSYAEEKKQGVIKYKAWIDEKRKESNFHNINFVFLPPLSGKHPQKMPVSMGYAAYPTKYLSSLENEKIIRKISMSGINLIQGVRLDEMPVLKKHGMKESIMLPFITLAGHFPLATGFLKEHPEYKGMNAKGEPVNVIDLAWMLEPGFPFREKVKEVIAEYVKSYPDQIYVWDHETDYTAPGKQFAYTKKSIELFRKRYKIAGNIQLTAQVIHSKYMHEWKDFICRYVGEMNKLYYEAVKEADSESVYYFYSGYPPHSKEKYGTDWNYIKDCIDFAMVGYGGNPEPLLNTVKQNYVCNGIAMFNGYVDYRGVENTIFSVLTSAGAYHFCTTAVLDDRHFNKMSRAGSVASDFEDFFLNLKVSLKTGLVADAKGKTLSDIPVFERNNERLLIVQNTSLNPETRVFRNVNLPKDYVGIDYDTKAVIRNPESMKVTVAPLSAKAVYLCPAEKLAKSIDAAPEPQETVAGPYPILRWNVKGNPLKKYTVQYAQNPEFSNPVTINDIVPQYCQLTDKLPAGGTLFWRVRSVNLNGQPGPWSKTASVNISEENLLKYKRPADYYNPLRNLGYWYGFPWGGAGGILNSVTLDTKESLSGKYSLKYIGKFPYSGATFANSHRLSTGVSTELVRLKKGQHVCFSAWIKTDGNAQGRISIALTKDGVKGLISKTSGAVANSPKWKKVSVEVKAPQDCYVKLCFNPSGKGSAWCDNTTLTVDGKEVLK